jgi:hypothetical protein
VTGDSSKIALLEYSYQIDWKAGSGTAAQKPVNYYTTEIHQKGKKPAHKTAATWKWRGGRRMQRAYMCLEEIESSGVISRFGNRAWLGRHRAQPGATVLPTRRNSSQALGDD